MCVSGGCHQVKAMADTLWSVSVLSCNVIRTFYSRAVGEG